MRRYVTDVFSASSVGFSRNSIESLSPKKKYSAISGTDSIHTIFVPAQYPLFTLSHLPAPMFCAVKLDTPLPSVVNDVITRLFSLTPDEYPAITAVPNVFITP